MSVTDCVKLYGVKFSALLLLTSPLFLARGQSDLRFSVSDWTSQPFGGGLKLVSKNTKDTVIYVSPALRKANSPLSAIRIWDDIIAPGTGARDKQDSITLANGVSFLLSAYGRNSLHLERLTASVVAPGKIWYAVALEYPAEKKGEASPYGRLLGDLVRQLVAAKPVLEKTKKVEVAKTEPTIADPVKAEPIKAEPAKIENSAPAPPVPSAKPVVAVESPRVVAPSPAIPSGAMKLSDVNRIEVIVLPKGGPTAVYLFKDGTICSCVDIPLSRLNLAKVSPERVGRWTRVEGGLRIKWPGGTTFDRPGWNSKPAQKLPPTWRADGTYALTLAKDPAFAPSFTRGGITFAADGMFTESGSTGHYSVKGYELVLAYDSGKTLRVTAVTQGDGSLWMDGQRFGLKK